MNAYRLRLFHYFLGYELLLSVYSLEDTASLSTFLPPTLLVDFVFGAPKGPRDIELYSTCNIDLGANIEFA